MPSTFEEIHPLAQLYKKACQSIPKPKGEILRLGVLSSYTLSPILDWLRLFLFVKGFQIEIYEGNFNQIELEILNDQSQIYAFKPQMVWVFPKRPSLNLPLTTDNQIVKKELENTADTLHQHLAALHEKTKAEILLCNFALPPAFDPGPIRQKKLSSAWNQVKYLNQHLGLHAPSFIHICDIEFLSARYGLAHAQDAKSWYESKQFSSFDFQILIAKEMTYLIAHHKKGMQKVLVLDLDNTLWGGIIGDDGLEGIELGATSPRGEAFLDFQKYIRTLKDRGVLLAVCSQNDEVVAKEVFERHPEMVLQLSDIASFQADWQPKPEKIQRIAEDLNLHLEHFAFVDDNPAEIALVQQTLPMVNSICLQGDPAEYQIQLQDSRFFEPQSITKEDGLRAQQYQQEKNRVKLQTKSTNIKEFLQSLQMKAIIRRFEKLDIPRITQLINKSNQYNLTTKRRTESEVMRVMNDENFLGLTVRLKDQFGDHGLISVLIAEKKEDTYKIDTWLMSCRVLSRQVEYLLLQELSLLAKKEGVNIIEGVYLPTPKNALVNDHYERLGFQKTNENPETYQFQVDGVALKDIFIDCQERLS